MNFDGQDGQDYEETDLDHKEIDLDHKIKSYVEDANARDRVIVKERFSRRQLFVKSIILS